MIAAAWATTAGDKSPVPRNDILCCLKTRWNKEKERERETERQTVEDKRKKWKAWWGWEKRGCKMTNEESWKSHIRATTDSLSGTSWNCFSNDQLINYLWGKGAPSWHTSARAELRCLFREGFMKARFPDGLKIPSGSLSLKSHWEAAKAADYSEASLVLLMRTKCWFISPCHCLWLAFAIVRKKYQMGPRHSSVTVYALQGWGPEINLYATHREKEKGGQRKRTY